MRLLIPCAIALTFVLELVLASKDTKDTPNIALLSKRAEELGYWIATEILTKDIRLQAKAVKKFIQVGVHCLELGNFNSLMGIISGLNSSYIARLKVHPKPVETYITFRFHTANVGDGG